MAIDFPNSPSIGQSYTVDTRTWKYDGQKWVFIDNTWTIPDTSTMLRDTLVRIYMEVF